MDRRKNPSSIRSQKEEMPGRYVFRFKGRNLRDLFADGFIFLHELEGGLIGTKWNHKKSR